MTTRYSRLLVYVRLVLEGTAVTLCALSPEPFETFMLNAVFVARPPQGELFIITVQLSSPKPDGQDYSSVISIAALGIHDTVFGIDALQTLCLCYKRLHQIFQSQLAQGVQFCLPAQPDIPIDVIALYFSEA